MHLLPDWPFRREDASRRRWPARLSNDSSEHLQDDGVLDGDAEFPYAVN